MIENLIPATLTLSGAALATKLFVASLRDPRRRDENVSTIRRADRSPAAGER